MKKTFGKTIIGIDPGNEGAFVSIPEFKFWKMPVIKVGTRTEVDCASVRVLLEELDEAVLQHVFLERAIPFAMGALSAFNYGRGFAAIEHSLIDLDIPYTLVEPTKWSRAMHAGIKGDLKPKAKSAIAVRRLFPAHAKLIPKSRTGKIHEGVMDALLIAGYGQRTLGETADVGDFY